MTLVELFENEPKKVLDMVLTQMKELADEHKSEDTKIYQLRYHNGTTYRGIHLTRVNYRASNKYELWLKIYDYFLKNSSYSDAIYYEDCAYDTLTEYYQITTYPNDRNAINHVIEYQLANFIEGDTLWWETIGNNVIEV